MALPTHPTSVHVDDVDLAYLEQGRGDPIVFVHGSVNDYRSWRGQLTPFAEDYRVVAYSRRYHWPNAQPADGVTYAVARHAADLGALIESLGLAPVHLVGSSYGAMTALALAIQRPALVRSLTLGEPPVMPLLRRTPDGSPLYEAFMANAFRPAGQAFARGEMEAGVRIFINGVIGLGAFDRLPEPARQMMLDNARSMQAETTSPAEQYFLNPSDEDLARLRIPALLLTGELSPPMFGLITDELERLLPNTERAAIPAASHGMHGQNPSAYNAAVRSFLAVL